MKFTSVVKKPLILLSVAFGCLIVVPLYVIMAFVIVRTDLLDPRGPNLTDEQLKAVWAFLGVALGTAATVFGALLAKSNSDRTLAQQSESQRRIDIAEAESNKRKELLEAESNKRRELAETESNNRHKLDTAVQALNLIKQGEGYSAKAVTAGSLATLVHLGHPIIAMLALEPALNDENVDINTGVWLVDQVLIGRSTLGTDADLSRSKFEAVNLLTNQLLPKVLDDSKPGLFNWPSSAVACWPKGLSYQAGWSLMHGLISMIISRPASWWTGRGTTWTWVIYTLDELVQEPSSVDGLRYAAATYGTLLLSAVGDEELVEGITDNRDPREVEQRFSKFRMDPNSLQAWQEVSKWCREALSGETESNEPASAPQTPGTEIPVTLASPQVDAHVAEQPEDSAPDRKPSSGK